ncbi:MAG: sigma-70 family RNA polymerase sigma factor [Acidimicrobiia bacterium]|nr:sigma-70 family RNA polymerase sigma factor [Acidimicrobiia bacterium]
MDERIPRDPGDGRAELFAELYATHYRPLVALCRRLSGSGDGEELAQEAFLRAWSSWDRYAPGRPFWPWVSTIARRLCIDRGRRLKTAQLRGPYAAARENQAVATPEELFDANEEYRWAREALEQLRPDQRRVIRLADVEGWSYDRIADHEGVTVESVRGSLRRARSRLRLVYTQMSSWSPAIVALALLRDLRRRLTGAAHRVEANAAWFGTLNGRAADAVAALVVLAMGVGPAVVPGSSAPSAVAASAAGVGVVTSTSAPGATSPPTTGSAAARAGRSMMPGAPGAGGGQIGGDWHRGLAGPLGGLNSLPGRGGSTPESATFMSFTASPNYQRDHEIYASGDAVQGCAISCPALFHSADGGAHWTRLAGLGFEGGTVMLPPAYPADGRIFVGGPHALKVSTDDGATFTPLTPAGGFTAMSPAFSAGDGHILVGAIPGWIYDDNTKAVTPFDAVPESTSAALSFSYAPAYPRDHRIVVGGTDTSPSQNAEVSACDGSNCTPPADLPGLTNTPAVLASKRYSATGLAYAWGVDKLYRSTDGARTFAPLQVPARGSIQDVEEDDQGALYVAVWGIDAAGSTGGLLVSHDAGTTWTRLGTGTVLDAGVLSVIALPSGNLLVGPYRNTAGGLQCSSDGGRTWAPRCQ